MRIYINILILWLSLSFFFAVAQTVDAKDASVYVTAQGQSVNKDEALKKALVSAIENVAGVFVINKESFSTSIYKQEISSLSTGYVKKYQVIDEKKDNEGLVTITVKALVLLQPLLKYSDTTSTGEKLDGNSIFATVITSDNLEQSRVKFLKYIKEYKPKFNTRVLSQVLDPDPEKKLMHFFLEVKWDQSYIDNLKTIMGLISIASCSGDIDKTDEKLKRVYNLPPPCQLHRKFNKQNDRIVETKISHSKIVNSNTLSMFQKLYLPVNLPKFVAVPLKDKDEYFIWDNKSEKCFTSGINSEWKKFNFSLYDSSEKIKYSSKENAKSAERDGNIKNFISDKFFSESLADEQCGIRADASVIYMLSLKLNDVMNILPSITRVDAQLIE
jgi:hypothetical protein